MNTAQLRQVVKHLKQADKALAECSPADVAASKLYAMLSDLIGEVEELAEERSAPRPVLND